MQDYVVGSTGSLFIGAADQQSLASTYFSVCFLFLWIASNLFTALIATNASQYCPLASEAVIHLVMQDKVVWSRIVGLGNDIRNKLGSNVSMEYEV